MRVLIAEGHETVRHRLVELVTTEPGVVLVGETADRESALRETAALCPDLMIVGPRLQDASGFAVVEALDPPLPTLILLCERLNAQYLYSATALGVSYVLEFPRDVDLLPDLLRHLRDGNAWSRRLPSQNRERA